MKSINLYDTHGLITFPSFHSCAAVLLTWGFWSVRRARVPAAGLNLLMLMATPIDGAHYLVDVLGGVSLAGLAIAAASLLAGRRPVPAAPLPQPAIMAAE